MSHTEIDTQDLSPLLGHPETGSMSCPSFCPKARQRQLLHTLCLLTRQLSVDMLQRSTWIEYDYCAQRVSVTLVSVIGALRFLRLLKYSSLFLDFFLHPFSFQNFNNPSKCHERTKVEISQRPRLKPGFHVQELDDFRNVNLSESHFLLRKWGLK